MPATDRVGNNHCATSVWIATTSSARSMRSSGFGRRIDLAGVDGRVFANNASLGVYAKIVQSADYRHATAETVTRMVLAFSAPAFTVEDGALVKVALAGEPTVLHPPLSSRPFQRR